MKKEKESQNRAAKTVLEIVSISASSGRSVNDIDDEAMESLQEVGFVELKASQRKVFGGVPGNQKWFLVEYDTFVPPTGKPFKIICMHDGTCTLWEEGRIIYVQSEPGRPEMFRICARGDRLFDWDFLCKVPSPKVLETYLQISREKGIQPPRKPLRYLSYEERVEERRFMPGDEGELPPDTEPGCKKRRSGHHKKSFTAAAKM